MSFIGSGAGETLDYSRKREQTHLGARLAGYPAVLAALPELALRFYAVPDLDGLVDRDALLRGDVEPPYWAYPWAGSRSLAAYLDRWVDVRRRRVLEIGCGLGLPGLVAARRGADVVFVDGAPPALAFVRASLAANGLAAATVCADFHSLAPTARFEHVLAAEVAYEPATFDALAATLARHLAPGGAAYLADGFRTDTRALYRALAAHGLATRSIDLRPLEEGRPTPVRLTVASRR